MRLTLTSLGFSMSPSPIFSLQLRVQNQTSSPLGKCSTGIFIVTEAAVEVAECVLALRSCWCYCSIEWYSTRAAELLGYPG